jgi:hypothetical protein
MTVEELLKKILDKQEKAIKDEDWENADQLTKIYSIIKRLSK